MVSRRISRKREARHHPVDSILGHAGDRSVQHSQLGDWPIRGLAHQGIGPLGDWDADLLAQIPARIDRRGSLELAKSFGADPGPLREQQIEVGPIADGVAEIG